MPRPGSGMPLIARAVEWRALCEQLDGAVAGTPGAALLAGEAGVGKTRLLQELTSTAAARGALVLRGRCLDVGDSGMPYLPFVEVVAGLAAKHPELLAAHPALAPLVPDAALPESPEAGAVPPPPGGGAARRGADGRGVGQLRLYEAVLGAVADAAAERPVVLAVEDVHWAEPSTLQLLSFLIARLRAQRVLIVASYRTDELHRRHPLRAVLAELVRDRSVRRVELEPLSSADAGEFVRALAADAGFEPPSELLRDIVDRCEGNAFFAEELFAAAGEHHRHLPWALADVLLARLERRSPQAARLLGIASVGGRWIRHPRLAAVAELCELSRTELEAALREALEHHLLVVDGEQGRYGFRHALVREAVYGDLLPSERTRLHRCYAEVIAGESGRGAPAALAHHSMESGALETALRASIAACDEAERLGAPREALRHIERALRVSHAVAPQQRPGATPEAELLREASSLCGATGQPDRAVQYARDGVRSAESAGEPIELAYALQRLTESLSGYDEAGSEPVETIERAWSLVRETGDQPAKASVLAARARALRRVDTEASMRAAEAAIVEAEQLGDTAIKAGALVTLGAAERHCGRPDPAREHYLEAERLAVRVGAPNAELHARFMRGLLEFELGALDRAIPAYDEALTRAGEHGLALSVFGIEVRIQLAATLFQTGDWDRSLDVAASQGFALDPVVHARLDAVSLAVLIGRGAFTEAQRSIDGVRDRWRLDWQIPAGAGLGEAELHCWRGDYAAALRAVDAVLAFFADVGEPYNVAGIRAGALGLRAIVEAGGCARAGVAADRCEQLLEHAEQAAHGQRFGAEARAWLVMARAEHARVTGVERSGTAAAAVEAFGYGDVYTEAIARYRYAEALLVDGDRAGATYQVRSAAETASRLGAAPLHEAVTALARRARLGADTDGGVDSVLTDRERSVLELVAAGKTNREVGANLYISEKTVSVHLSRAMAKLGATRRAEAVAIAYDRGLLACEPLTG